MCVCVCLCVRMGLSNSHKAQHESTYMYLWEYITTGLVQSFNH